MRFSLRTLLIVLVLSPPLAAWAWLKHQAGGLVWILEAWGECAWKYGQISVFVVAAMFVAARVADAFNGRC